MGTSSAAGFGKNRWVILLLSLALAAWGSGCQWKGGDRPTAARGHGGGEASGGADAATRPVEDEIGETWRPVPVSMRVYPSSRFVQEGPLTVLEARIELLDQMGDTVKGGGRFHFELLEAAAGGAGVAGQRLYAWEVPLTTLEQQRQYWDPITRTYQFRLKMNAPGSADLPGSPMTLRARLTGMPGGPGVPGAEAGDERHLTAEAGIRQ